MYKKMMIESKVFLVKSDRTKKPELTFTIRQRLT